MWRPGEVRVLGGRCQQRLGRLSPPPRSITPSPLCFVTVTMTRGVSELLPHLGRPGQRDSWRSWCGGHWGGAWLLISKDPPTPPPPHLLCVHFPFGCSHEERGWDFAQPAPSGPWLVRGEPVSCLSWHLALSRHHRAHSHDTAAGRESSEPHCTAEGMCQQVTEPRAGDIQAPPGQPQGSG